MKKLKQFTLVSVVFGGLFFLFGSEVVPENFQPQEILDIAANSDVIIIFNSGGWGDTPFEKAEDFAPIVEEIQKTLNSYGYDSIVIPYQRTKNTLPGKIASAKDFLNFFNFSSDTLAKDLEFLAESLPDKKIILAGLSAGGALVEETMAKISDYNPPTTSFHSSLRSEWAPEAQVYAVAVGIPFWQKTIESENTLLLDNSGKDTLSAGEIKSLISALVKVPFKWISAKINGDDLTFSQALQAPGHDYLWDSPEVGFQIVTFLENKIR